MVKFSRVHLNTFARIHRWLLTRGIEVRQRTWKDASKSDESLLKDLVCQVAVVGRAGAGKRVLTDPAIAQILRWDQHLQRMDYQQRAQAMHGALKKAGARFAGKELGTCRYSYRLAESLGLMEAAGGPISWMHQIKRLKSERERVAKLRELPSLGGMKSPRDFLSTKLGLATKLVALDIRIMQVLNAVAPEIIYETATPSHRRYEAIEEALIEQVAPALGCTGFELDQLLFKGNEDRAILNFLERTPGMKLRQQCRVCVPA